MEMFFLGTYTTDDGSTQLEVKLEKDTVWLTFYSLACVPMAFFYLHLQLYKRKNKSWKL